MERRGSQVHACASSTSPPSPHVALSPLPFEAQAYLCARYTILCIHNISISGVRALASVLEKLEKGFCNIYTACTLPHTEELFQSMHDDDSNDELPCHDRPLSHWWRGEQIKNTATRKRRVNSLSILVYGISGRRVWTPIPNDSDNDDDNVVVSCAMSSLDFMCPSRKLLTSRAH